MKMKTGKKKLLLIPLILILLLAEAAVLIAFATAPVPEAKRNQTVDGLRVEASVSDDERLPIIKTFRREDYEKKSESEKQKIEESTRGNIEGDIPCVHLLKDPHIYFRLTAEGKSLRPDEMPIVEIKSLPSHREHEKEPKIFFGEVREDAERGYSCALRAYRRQYEKYFLESDLITLRYTVHGREYVSMFSVSVSNAEEGVDFFENEELKEPISPQEP